MTNALQWPGYAAFHAAKKAAREAGQPEPTREAFAATLPRHIPLLTPLQQAD